MTDLLCLRLAAELEIGERSSDLDAVRHLVNAGRTQLILLPVPRCRERVRRQLEEELRMDDTLEA